MLFFFFFFWSRGLCCMACGMWDLSSPTRDWTQALGRENTESQPLDRQGILPAHALCIRHTPSQTCHVSGTVVLNQGQFWHFAKSGSIRVVTIGGGGRVLLASSGQRPGMLLTVARTGPPPISQQRIIQPQRLVRATVEKFWSRTGSGTWKTSTWAGFLMLAA